jgi:xylono-1,5-lactonase
VSAGAAVAGPPRLLWPAGAELGEGPLWDESAGAIWWLDIEGRRLHRADAQGGSRRSWEMPGRIGCLALTADPGGRLLLGLESGLHLFAPEAGPEGLEALARPAPWPAGCRPNDGKVDARGRFWFGTMDTGEREGGGALHRLDPDGTCRLIEGGWTIPNGPVLSPNGARLLWADSHRRCVFAFALGADGKARNQGVFLRFSEDAPGVPDGMAMDAEGCLWITHNGGGRLTRHAADGRLLEVVPLPARAVSSCAFGGPGLATLFVTTARQGAGAGEAEAAGALFAIPTATRGLPPGRLRLDRWNDKRE